MLALSSTRGDGCRAGSRTTTDGTNLLALLLTGLGTSGGMLGTQETGLAITNSSTRHGTPRGISWDVEAREEWQFANGFYIT